MTQRSSFRDFKSIPEVTRLAVMIYIRFPLSRRNQEDLDRMIEGSTSATRRSGSGGIGSARCLRGIAISTRSVPCPHAPTSSRTAPPLLLNSAAFLLTDTLAEQVRQ